ncbi:hypothetical protein [Novosphingobium sp. FKTRR1]|uniref:hypothetical protein n=1 Tax=Novosphingobium sp. FKTRR1 TaxID=2879118 RepID=UPI001CF02EE8|nr:hypothetical protein [Novosphingobium sp. FKTRR1]
MGDELNKQIGAGIVGVMRDMATINLPEGLEVEEGSLEFNLKPECGLPGRWRVTVERIDA